MSNKKKLSNKQLMGIINRSRREKERWIRELWLDRSRCGKMEYNLFYGSWKERWMSN